MSDPLAMRPDPAIAVPQDAMVLAAGLGKRMRPLTATRPKPLVEVAGRTMLDRALDRIRAAGVARAVVNVHYLADRVEAHLAARDQRIDVRLSDERGELLETGGGVAKALPLIGADPFYVVNSDNLWIDGPVDTLKLLAQRWDGAQMDALLLLVPLARAQGYDGSGDFHMDPGGKLKRRNAMRVAPFVFSGLQMLSKRLLDGAPDGPFSLNWAYDKALADGRLYGLVHQGLWFHVGTPQAVTATEALLANG